VFLFDDLHHEDLQGNDASRVEGAVLWYRNHLCNCNVECVLLDTHDRVDDYFMLRWKDNDTLLNLYTSQKMAAETVHTKKLSRSVRDLLDIEQGIEQGRYVRGVLRVDSVHRDKAVVIGDVENVYVLGKEDRWHAIHGDQVVVELYNAQEVTPAGTQTDEEEAKEDVGFLDSLEDSVIQDGRQWKSRVIHISENTQRPDVLVSISRQDEDALKMHQQQTVSSVLCIPFDGKFPIMRMRSRYMEKYIGKRLLVRIIAWEDDSAYPDVHVLQALGPTGDLQTERNCILHRHGLMFEEFSKSVLAELPSCDSTEYSIPQEEIKRELNNGRVDLRSRFVVSIDPPGCTDVDDAFHVNVIDECTFELGIHIADVTYFVKAGSLLDEEAAHRCTTVYLVDQRLNMLPSTISEDAASLLCGKPRFAVSVVWKISRKTFEVNDVWFGRSVIQSRYQLEYMQAQSILNGSDSPSECGTKTREDIRHLRRTLELVRDLAWRRLHSRLRKGAIELDSKELHFDVNEQGMPCSIHEKSSIDTMKIVAELMIMANESVGNKLQSLLPTSALLRCHESPTKDKLEQMREFYSKCKERITHLDDGGGALFMDPESFGKDLGKLANLLSGNSCDTLKSLLQITANRSLSEARYVSAGSLSSHWHFGLAVDCYTHFTSPIRRYADIIVHRQLLHAIGSSSIGQDPIGTLQSKIETINKRNREAKLAQRECSHMYLLLYLAKYPQKRRAIVQAVDSMIHLYVPGMDLKARVPLKDHHVKPFDSVLVLLTSNISSYHGPCLEVSIVKDGEGQVEEEYNVPSIASLRISEDEIIEHTVTNEDEVKEDDSLPSLLHALSLSKENWTRKPACVPRSYILEGTFPKKTNPTMDEAHSVILEATRALLEKSRAYTKRAARYTPGSEQNLFWINHANLAATNANSLQSSMYCL